MKHTLTKAQIIRALKTEPLKRGKWHHSRTARANKTCKVCAVGAILRQMKWNFHDMDAIELAACEGGNHPVGSNPLLVSLSRTFEFASADGGDEFARKEAIKFVRKNFPAKLEIELAD